MTQADRERTRVSGTFMCESDVFNGPHCLVQCDSCKASKAKPKVKKDDAISTEARQVCDCCRRLKTCKMFVLQTGTTAWVCLECREGRE